MNDTDHLQRGPGDFILFGLMFFAFVLGVAGVIASSIPAAITGGLLFALGLVSFIIKAAF